MTRPDKTLPAEEYYALVTVAHFARCVVNLIPLPAVETDTFSDDLLDEVRTLRAALAALESPVR